MLVVRLGERKPAHPDDPLGRAFIGGAEDLTPQQWAEAGRGVWRMNPDKAAQQSHLLIVYAGLVRAAMAIERVVPAGGRHAVEGRLLGPGDPVHEAFVGQAPPTGTASARNPLTYLDTPGRTCRCGCGGHPGIGKAFLSGHDVLAFRRIVETDFEGRVENFLDWYDRAPGASPGSRPGGPNPPTPPCSRGRCGASG